MATVYRGVEKIVAREAKPAVKEKTEELAVRARSRLGTHRSSGNARIETSMGKTDGFVELVDPGPDGNALAIEFGRSASSEHGAMQGIYPLSHAIGKAPS